MNAPAKHILTRTTHTGTAAIIFRPEGDRVLCVRRLGGIQKGAWRETLAEARARWKSLTQDGWQVQK